MHWNLNESLRKYKCHKRKGEIGQNCTTNFDSRKWPNSCLKLTGRNTLIGEVCPPLKQRKRTKNCKNIWMAIQLLLYGSQISLKISPNCFNRRRNECWPTTSSGNTHFYGSINSMNDLIKYEWEVLVIVFKESCLRLQISV